MIPYGRQSISQTDIDAVIDVLKSDFLTQGPAIPKFESAMAERVGARHAIAVNSATSALHIACLALGVGPGDLVWSTPNTFVASTNCALYCGASVDFVDIDPVSWNISTVALTDKLRQASAAGNLPKVLVVVHFSGQPCDMEQIHSLAKHYGFKIIEDASHAVGATYGDTTIGDCCYSDITVFSFHPVKIITSGEGGMALCNDDELAWRMSMFRSHGITRDPARMQALQPDAWHYEQQLLGYNYRMIDIEAALGLSQMSRLDEFVSRRNDLARRYDDLLAGLDLQRPHIAQDRTSAFHLYVVRTRKSAEHHRSVFEHLRQLGIGANLHYTPVHLQPYYRQLGFEPGMFPQAERYAETAITLPLYPDLTEQQQDDVVHALEVSLG